jgi:hypothetical protein
MNATYSETDELRFIKAVLLVHELGNTIATQLRTKVKVVEFVLSKRRVPMIQPDLPRPELDELEDRPTQDS